MDRWWHPSPEHQWLTTIYVCHIQATNTSTSINWVGGMPHQYFLYPKSNFWRVNVLYFVGIGSQPQKTWRHRETGTEPQKTWRHATMMAETGNHYRYGNGNMVGQTTTWPLCNHFLITYQKTLTHQIVKLWSAWLKLLVFFLLLMRWRGANKKKNWMSVGEKVVCISQTGSTHLPPISNLTC